jgi:Uma2 family endonuclease
MEIKALEMLKQEQLYVVEEFEHLADAPENADRLLELINGEIVEKVPTEEHGVIALNIATPIKVFLQKNKLGRVGVEIRHRRPGDQYNARQPDVSFRSDTTSPVVTRGSVLQMPDLAIEIRSPDQAPRELREKAAYYLRNGSRLVWLVYPQTKTVEVSTLDTNGSLNFKTLTVDETLDGAEVLPGFTLPVREIFEL